MVKQLVDQLLEIGHHGAPVIDGWSSSSLARLSCHTRTPVGHRSASFSSSDSTLLVSPSWTPGRRSAFSTTDMRGATSATASTARFTTSMTSSHSPSIVVNIASVWLGSPLERTTCTARATTPETASPTPKGVTENATIMTTPPSFLVVLHLSRRIDPSPRPIHNPIPAAPAFSIGGDPVAGIFLGWRELFQSPPRRPVSPLASLAPR